jgi:hypothetical protein
MDQKDVFENLNAYLNGDESNENSNDFDDECKSEEEAKDISTIEESKLIKKKRK